MFCFIYSHLALFDRLEVLKDTGVFVPHLTFKFLSLHGSVPLKVKVVLLDVVEISLLVILPVEIILSRSSLR